jgi:hypothetical protein
MDRLVKDVRKSPPEVGTILVRRRAAHGDVLVAASVCSALKKKYPDSKIVFSTLCPEILQNNPWVDRVQEEQSERQFQMYVNLDMAYEYRPSFNVVNLTSLMAEIQNILRTSDPLGSKRIEV